MSARCATWRGYFAHGGVAGLRRRPRPTKWLCRPENLVALADLPGQWIDKERRRRAPKTIGLDMDSSESPTYGEQEGSAYNGHCGCTCYHPLFVFNQFGDVERCVLRPGN